MFLGKILSNQTCAQNPFAQNRLRRETACGYGVPGQMNYLTLHLCTSNRAAIVLSILIGIDVVALWSSPTLMRAVVRLLVLCACDGMVLNVCVCVYVPVGDYGPCNCVGGQGDYGRSCTRARDGWTGGKGNHVTPSYHITSASDF